ncbi:hypothetical protein EI77_03948 [Prosthecobacter fusiformis]|uniref:Uncharacterized protein n=1 Tax=Prosthecobacter fusiformis TaxID=48464 RepID=A0A4R7RML3_9BACT|nr:hypothetical protein [Prosthecobacter fusiformis]TDU66209.1 hypothetical protein EI77_03948 [Prosthecobacter fusiformis]
MSFLKRFEVWLLIILSLGATIWVFTMDSDPSMDDPQPVLADASSEAALKIHRTTLERDYGNARLDIELRYRNSSPRPLSLQPPDVRLLTADGKEVPPFTLATEKPPQIPAQSAQDVRLRYWLEKGHLNGALILEIRGEKADVKTASPIDLDTLENGKPKTWTGAIQ